MKLKSFLSTFLVGALAIAVMIMPTPALAALTPINTDAQNGQLTVLATESKDLPGFTNKLSYPVKVKIQAEGQWRGSKEGEQLGQLVDADGGYNPALQYWLYPELKLGTLVGEIKDAKGVRKSISSGKNQEFQLQPGETASFIFNDGADFFGDNDGSQKLTFSILANQPITWGTSATNFRGQLDKEVSYLCPPNGTASRVWGTDIYTDDSSICSAAVHAGLISLSQGGPITIKIQPGQSSYAGTSKNSITTSNYGAWSGSYVFVK